MDLVNLIDFSEQNRGYRHILNIIDVFSSFNMATAVKSKTAGEVIGALGGVCMQYGYTKIL